VEVAVGITVGVRVGKDVGDGEGGISDGSQAGRIRISNRYRKSLRMVALIWEFLSKK
jgi:hypothetical protein